ncbi:MAG: DUF3617 domain-containing protein [Methylophilus sp.]
MQKILMVLTLACPLLINNANAEEFDMRSGLWEITTTSDLLLLAPHIPTDQMQELQKLAKEYGYDMPKIENGAAISKTCITPEMAKQKTMPNLYQEQTGCRSKNATRNGNSYKIDFTCDSVDLKGNGKAEGSLTSPEHFTGQTQFNGVAQGNPVNEKAEIAGKWVNASCGDVKPM